jgi:hypothetical protein
MKESTEEVISALAQVKVEDCRRHQTGMFEDKRIEHLSEALRTHARLERQHNSNAYLYDRSELALWPRMDGHLLDEALEFMSAQGWAGKSGLPDTWWIT